MGKLFVISGASGVGKSTVLAKVMAGRQDLRFSVSATTRAPRPGEVDGREYYFVTHETFRDMIAKDAVEIGENEDFGSLYDRMGKSGGKLLVSTIPMIENGTVVREVQDDAFATYASKIEKAECALDFSDTAQNLHNKIRALSPAPLGVAVLKTEKETKNLKLVSTVVVEKEGVHGDAGKVLAVDAKKGMFTVACGEGVLGVLVVVPEGKGKMNAGDFIRGRKIDAGDILLTPDFNDKK